MKFLDLLSVVAVPLISARAVTFPQQIPIIPEVAESPAVKQELGEDVAPSVGVHFTNSYAVAAARYRNSTTRNIIRVEGDAEYISIMSRWMDGYSNQEAQDECNCSATDVATLSSFFSKVRLAIDTELDSPSTRIAPAVFPLRQPQLRAFRDAWQFAGFPNQQEEQTIVHAEADAAYATLSHESCPIQTKDSTCIFSKPSHPKHGQNILFLAFDNSSFSASMHTFRSSLHRSSLLSYVARSNLGWWNLPVFQRPRANFWTQVQECIVDATKRVGKPPGRIVLLGSHGGDAEFKGVVEEVFWREWEVDVGMLLSGNENGAEHGEWLVAKGVAEMWRDGN